LKTLYNWYINKDIDKLLQEDCISEIAYITIKESRELVKTSIFFGTLIAFIIGDTLNSLIVFLP